MPLSEFERGRLVRRARRRLLPGAIKAAGREGFTKTRAKLAGKPGVRTPTLLAGWLKKKASERGQLAPEHAYGRRGK